MPDQRNIISNSKAQPSLSQRPLGSALRHTIYLRPHVRLINTKARPSLSRALGSALDSSLSLNSDLINREDGAPLSSINPTSESYDVVSTSGTSSPLWVVIADSVYCLDNLKLSSRVSAVGKLLCRSSQR
jgi:hypothetical protein